MLKSVLTPWITTFLAIAACAQGPASVPTSSSTPEPMPIPACKFVNHNQVSLALWRPAGFDTETPDQAARDHAACLAHPDPFLRDKIGYEGLTVVLRSGAVTEEVRRYLISTLSTALSSEDAFGVHAPFAALGLAELARTDRIEAFLSEDERAALVTVAATYLGGVSDYRAFSETEGWRHGVAHGADFAMQLSLNPNVSTDSLLEIREAIAVQISPASGHAYTHGEPERLARPILFMASRGEIEASSWEIWFRDMTNPAPLANWGDAFSSEAALARLHNLKAFAQSLYINASLSENPNLDPIATGALEMLKTLP